MIPCSKLSVNLFDKRSINEAKELGFGLEIEEYLWIYGEDKIKEKHDLVSRLMDGFTKLSFHGTAVSRDLIWINKLSDSELLSLYNDSYAYSRYHGINRIVYHSNYLSDFQPRDLWIRKKAAFWREYLMDKPPDFAVYVENFADDTPELLSELHDMVDDVRFKICFDTGHAGCNSPIELAEWIKRLGRRIEHVHLHNNDGISDKHWPLGKGILDMVGAIEGLLTYFNVQTFVLECNFADSLQWLQRNNLFESA